MVCGTGWRSCRSELRREALLVLPRVLGDRLGGEGVWCMSKCTRGEIYSCARVQALEGHQRGSIRAAWELPEWNKRGTSLRWLRGRHRQARGTKGKETGHGRALYPQGTAAWHCPEEAIEGGSQQGGWVVQEEGPGTAVLALVTGPCRAHRNLPQSTVLAGQRHGHQATGCSLDCLQ